MRPQNQTVMAGLIAIVISVAFLGVAYVDYAYAQSSPIEQLYLSDSSQTFYNYTYSPSTYEYQTTGLRYQDSGDYLQEPATPVYLGNNSWAVAIQGNPADTDYPGQLICMDIPNMNTWLIEYVNITLKFGSTPLPASDWILSLGAWGVGGLDEHIACTGYTGAKFYSWHLNTYESLLMKSYAEQNITHTMFRTEVRGIGTVVLPANAYEITLNITGTNILTWSIQDTINVVLGISIGLNILVGVYMTDSIDFGSIKRKDLQRKRRR